MGREFASPGESGMVLRLDAHDSGLLAGQITEIHLFPVLNNV